MQYKNSRKYSSLSLYYSTIYDLGSKGSTMIENGINCGINYNQKNSYFLMSFPPHASFDIFSFAPFPSKPAAYQREPPLGVINNALRVFSKPNGRKEKHKLYQIESEI